MSSCITLHQNQFKRVIRYTFEDKKEIYLELVSINEDDEELEKKAYNDVLKKYNLHETNLKEFFEEVIAKEETA